MNHFPCITPPRRNLYLVSASGAGNGLADLDILDHRRRDAQDITVALPPTLNDHKRRVQGRPATGVGFQSNHYVDDHFGRFKPDESNPVNCGRPAQVIGRQARDPTTSSCEPTRKSA